MRTPAYEQFSSLMRERAFARAAEHADQENQRRGGGDPFWLTQQAVALNACQRAEDARKAAEAALAAQPRNPYALRARAESLVRLQRFDEARADFEELAAAGPLVPRARDGYLECLAAARNWDRVLAFLGEADPAPRDRAWRARALHGLGRTPEAVEVCRLWLAEERDHPVALRLLADLEAEMEGPDVVRERYERLARIPGAAPIYREVHAALCRRSGLEEKAAAEYAALAAERPEGRLNRQEAFALSKAGREREAIELVEELLRESPRDPYVHSAYAAACRRAGELERAWKFYGDLLVLHPDEKGLYGRRKRIAGMLNAAEP
jgi:tetratricopeptide (TPR) repeat protein